MAKHVFELLESNAAPIIRRMMKSTASKKPVHYDLSRKTLAECATRGILGFSRLKKAIAALPDDMQISPELANAILAAIAFGQHAEQFQQAARGQAGRRTATGKHNHRNAQILAEWRTLREAGKSSGEAVKRISQTHQLTARTIQLIVQRNKKRN